MRTRAEPYRARKGAMQRRIMLKLGLVFLLLGEPAFAKDFAERVVDQLRDQGYVAVQVERTLLGRTRIMAEGRNGHREIILNPRTGEILRDLWISRTDQGGGGGGGGLIRDDDGNDGLSDGSDDDGGQGRGRGRGRGGDDADSVDEDNDSDSDDSGKGGSDDD